MKIFNKILVVALTLGLFGPIAVFAASPAGVNLGASGNFVILAKTGISTTGATSIVGDIGVSPAEATYITGFGLILPSSSAFSTSALITGKVYAPSYANQTPANLTTAVLDMQTAYTDASGRAADVTELGAGNIGGLTLVPGVYKWGTNVTIPTDITLSGGANDVWIFQIAQNLNISSATKIILAGGAQAKNIFWQVAGQTTLGTTSVFNGNILDQTTIVLNTGATLNGRALAQAAVTLDASIVTAPTSAAVVITPSPAVPATPAVSATPAVPTVTSAAPATPAVPATPSTMSDQDRLNELTVTLRSLQAQYDVRQGAMSAGRSDQDKLNDLMTNLKSLQAEQAAGQGAPLSSAFGQQIRLIAMNLGQGSKHNDVSTLQQFLISQNKGPAAEALAKIGTTTTYFGGLTRAALAEFQLSVGISPALGNFGAITRAYINANY